MKKIETIWNYLLQSALQEHKYRHTQKELAEQFQISTSTVHHAIRTPTEIGAIRKEGKFFVLQNFTKLLYYWASKRSLERRIVMRIRCNKHVHWIEGNAPPQCMFGGYTAAVHHLGEASADYDRVLLYVPPEYLQELQKRFPDTSSTKPDLIAITLSPYYKDTGHYTQLPWTFVDLWNMQDWYARDFCIALEEKMNSIISAA